VPNFIMERERVLPPTLPHVHDLTVEVMVVQEVEYEVQPFGKPDYQTTFLRTTILTDSPSCAVAGDCHDFPIAAAREETRTELKCCATITAIDVLLFTDRPRCLGAVFIYGVIPASRKGEAR
jgi:hypothetical protein